MEKNFFRIFLFTALFSCGYGLSCYQGRSQRYGDQTSLTKMNCTYAENVCLRSEYKLEGKTYILRDCASPKHISEKISSDREYLKSMSQDQNTLPDLQSIMTCQSKYCNTATTVRWNWSVGLFTAIVLCATALR